MQCTCTQQDLVNGLSIVARASASRSTLPILANILLASDRGRLKLVATNLEIGTTCWIDAVIEEEGATTVPAKLFTEHINSLSQMDEIHLSVQQDTHELLIQGQHERRRSNASIRGMNPEEFPQLPIVAENGTPPVELDAALLKEVIKQVAFAANEHDSRAVFTAVQMQLKKQKMFFAAADTFRLAVREVALPNLEESAEDLLIPARTLEELSRILPATGAVQILISSNRSQVLFHTEQIDLVSRLVEGTYPNIQAAIHAHGALPQAAKTRVVVNRKEFVDALRSAMPFARDSANITSFKISCGAEKALPGQMEIEAVAEDVGSNKSLVNAQVDGVSLEKIIFNCKYVSEVLAVLDCEEVAFEVTTAARPGVIKPVGDFTDAYTYIVMPMSTNR